MYTWCAPCVPHHRSIHLQTTIRTHDYSQFDFTNLQTDSSEWTATRCYFPHRVMTIYYLLFTDYLIRGNSNGNDFITNNPEDLLAD